MPAFLIPFLLKAWPYGLAAVALIGAVWYINHEGYERAQEQNLAANAKLDEDMYKLNIDLTTKIDGLQSKMQDEMNTSSTALAAQIGNIDQASKTIIQPTITKEIASAPRFTDPADGITDGMFNALNQARALGASSCSAGAVTSACSGVPNAAPAH